MIGSSVSHCTTAKKPWIGKLLVLFLRLSRGCLTILTALRLSEAQTIVVTRFDLRILFGDSSQTCIVHDMGLFYPAFRHNFPESLRVS